MTLAQFHAALRKKYPNVVVGDDDLVVRVPGMTLSFREEPWVVAECARNGDEGHGTTVNGAILDLQKNLRATIRAAKAALKDIQCTSKSKKQSSKATTSPPRNSASKG